ncbi:MAG: histidine kinase [Melioribacteraceae bacterium]|nr:histidine kinase [Melioribacteraceae bacterium]
MKSIILFSLLLFSESALGQSSLQFKKEIDSLQLAAGKSLTTKDSLIAIQTYYQIAKLYDRNGDLEKSNEFLIKALEGAKELKEYKLTGQVSNYLASNYSSVSKRKEALTLYEDAYNMFALIKDTLRMSAVLINIGTEYVSLTEYQKAIETELKALRLKVAAKDSSNIAYFHISLAELFFKIKNFDKWEEYLFTAKKLSENEEYADFHTRTKTLNELGEYYRRKNNIRKSIETYKTIYNISLKEEYINGISIALTNLVPLYIRTGDYINAEKAAYQSLEFDKKRNYVSGIIYNLVQLGSLNRNLNRNAISQKYLLEGLTLAQKHNSKENEIRAYEELYLVNKNLSNPNEALRYYEKYITERDSILDQETKRNIAEIETKYETENKENKIALLDNENKLHLNELANQRILIAGIIISASLFILLGFIYYRHNKTKDELKTLLAEHKMLRSQMNPHFIFNSLMAIQNYLFKNDSLKTADYLSEFASLMRLILTSSREDKISLEDELKITNYYLSLQKMRFNNAFEYTINVDNNIDQAATFLPPMLIQPFIENAVEHGMKIFANNEGRIIIDFTIRDSELRIVITDNGQGLIDKKQDGHISYATQITKERIAAIEKMKNGRIKLEITNILEDITTKGTSVVFTIPETFYNVK